MQSDWVEQVIRYWFEELRTQAWFRKDTRVDDTIRERFAALHDEVARIRPQQLTTPRDCLAAVIVLDQFSRNMFRGSPRSFETDALALSISQHAIAAGLDQQLDRQQRWFLYMPFQHSEDRAAQARSIELFTQLGDRENLGYAQRHKEIIDRFGRFPHRNEVLGRASTPEEAQFIATHRGF
ncbi:MAG TPA: DUF924 family protein [Steroidobacteraceae bacterium]|jgi:uncharacterized protein (DUF924 family)|nr:DUF924 family protein [Steroidobacteraceae bacterium]